MKRLLPIITKRAASKLVTTYLYDKIDEIYYCLYRKPTNCIDTL